MEFVMMTYIGRPLAAVTLLAGIFAASASMADNVANSLTWGTYRLRSTTPRYNTDGYPLSWGSYGIATATAPAVGKRKGTNGKRAKPDRD